MSSMKELTGVRRDKQEMHYLHRTALLAKHTTEDNSVVFHQ